jgi:hypothetical protein
VAASRIADSCTFFLGKPFMLLVLVAGARLLNYMQIEIEPFPLVA